MTTNTLKDKVCLITGATSGIGIETAIALANMGATIVVGGRDLERASNAVIRIRTASNNPNVDFLLADLSDFVEVKKFAEEFKQQYKRLDVLVNNAGAIFKEYDENPQGVEMTMALNLFSIYLLTGSLLDVLQHSAPSRIINVSSMVHKLGKNEFDGFNDESSYKALNSYALSKLGLLHFNTILSEKLKGTGITSNAMHPGWVKSNFGSGFYTGFYGFLDTIFKPVQISSQKGAETIVYLASSADVEKISGKYFVKNKAIPTSSASYNTKVSDYVWGICKQETGFDYDFNAFTSKNLESTKETDSVEKIKSDDDKPGGI